MWTPLVFLAIVGFVAGGQQTPWKPNQEYAYNIYARTLTALPDLKDQYVGVVTKGKLILHPKANGQIVGKLMKVAHAHFHDDLVGGWDSEIPEQMLSFQESNLNNKPFIMHMKNGVVKSVSVDPSMTNDEVNQLKAILSQLQVDITGENLIKSKHNQLPEKNNKPNALYRTMEATVTGECETIYDIEHLPEYMLDQTYPEWVPRTDATYETAKGQFFQVVKTMNFNHCHHRKGYHFGLTGESDFKPHTNQMGEFLSKSSMTNIVASGQVNDYTIHQVYTTNRVAVSPAMYQEQKAQVISQIHLILTKVQDVSKQMEGPQQPVETGNLVYRYNIPSDKDNKIRVGSDSGAYYRDETYQSQDREETSRMRIRRESQDEEDSSRSFYTKRQRLNQAGSSSSSSSESDEDFETQRHHFQPKPNMQQAPEIPLHPFTIGNKGRTIQHDPQVNVEGEARKLAQEIAEDLQVQDEIPKRDTLEKFDILTDIVRVMNLNQIQNVAQQLHLGNQQQSEKLSETLARKTFRDAVAQAGTGPAVNAISKWILDRKVKGDEAAELLTAVVKNVRIPTEELIKTLFNLVKSEEIKKQKELYPTALIVFTDLIRRAQVDRNSAYNHYPVQSFGPFYKELEQIVTKEVIPYLAQRLQESVQQKNAQKVLLYIRALGNTGHPDIVGIYEKYFEGEQITPFQRTAIVIAMDRLAQIYPRVARRVLYKIYANIAETPETRSAAVHLLMRTKPSAPMLQRMAEYTHEDPSEAVQAIVKSAIESAAELTDNEWDDLAKNAEAAKKFLNPREYGRQYSKTYLRDYVSDNLNLIYRQQLSHIVGRDHSFPQSIFYTVYKNYGGFEARNVEVQAMISSVDELLRLIPTRYHAEGDNKREQYQAGGEQWSTNRIEKMLNIERDEAEELEGQILFNVMGHKRFYSFDENTLKELPQALTAAGSVFANGERLTLNKLYNRRHVVVAFPLATGYPFLYTFSLPTLVQAVGDIQGKTTPDVMQSPSWEALRKVETVNITAKVHLVFSSEQIAKTGFITPFERQRYVAGHVRKIQGHVPLNLKIDIDIKNRQITGKMAPLDTKKDFEAIHASAWPFTARKDAYSIHPVSKAKDIKLIQTRRPEKFERTIGEKSTGMIFRANMEHQFPLSDDFFYMERTLQTQGAISLTSLPYSYQSTMQRILDRRVFKPLSFLPYSFEPTAYGPSEKQVLMMLAALPFGDDFSTREIVNTHGILSLLGLPFADVETLEKTARHEGILSVGMFPWPMKTLDHYKFNIKYDAQRSENQIMKFSLRLRRAYNADKDSGAASNRMSGPAAVDENKLAHTSDVTPNSEERQRQFLENAAFGIKQAYSVALDASLVFDGKSPAEYIATIGHAGSLADEKKRVLAFFSAKPVKKSSHKQMCLTYTGKFPHAPVLSFDEAIKQNNKANAKIQVAFGENCKSSATQMNMKVVLEQTSEYKQFLEKSDIATQCQYEMKQGDYLMPACLEATYRANIFDHIAISGDMQNPTPEINNITHRAIALLRHIGFWHLEENVNERGQPNKLEANIRISPSLRYLDAHIQTGSMTQNFNKLRIAPSLRSFFNVHQQLDIQDRNMNQLFRNGHVCVVDTNKVFTFDDAIIKPHIGQCWYSVFQHVQPKSHITKDQKWTPEDVSILVRAASQQANKKEVMIVVGQKNGQDHMVHLKPTGSSIQVTINGQEKKISKDKAIDVFDKLESHEQQEQHLEGQQPAVRIVELPGQEVEVEVRGKLIQVIFNGSRVKVLAYPSYRNHVRGLCGNFNGEQVDDLVTPKNCILNNEKLFAASWALHEQACSNEVKQMKTKAEQAHCVPIEHEGGNVISNWEAGRHGSNKQTRNKWSVETSSSSSSSEELNNDGQEYYQLRRGQQQEKQGERSCNLRNQVQFVEFNGRTCFSIDSLPACPSHCRVEETEQTEVAVHCRDSTDSVAQLFKQQIRKGANPDMSSKKANNNVTFKIPKNCVAGY